MYNTYFGFRERPFNITPDPRFFYTNPVYQEAYARLLYGIRERKGFLVLTGEVGTGKTTLLRRIISSLENDIQVAFFYNTTLSFDELLHHICEDFGLAVSADDRRLIHIQALNTFLLEQQEKGGTAVLFIDEAQNLDDEVLENLRLLSNLETASEKLLQIVLVGQPELEQKLSHPRLRALKQRVVIQCTLDCLKEREVGPFIQQRLQTAGYEGPALFSAEAVARIWLYSHGIPRLINVLCDNALILAHSLSQRQVSDPIVEGVASNLRLSLDEPQGSEGAREKAAVLSAGATKWQPREKQTTTSTSLFISHPPREQILEEWQQILENERREAEKEPRNSFLWFGRIVPWMVKSLSRQPLWVGIGILFTLCLLGGAGAAIYFHSTADQPSQSAVAEKKVLENMRDYSVTTVQPDLFTRLTSIPAKEILHNRNQDPPETPVGPTLFLQNSTRTSQYERLGPVIKPLPPSSTSKTDESNPSEASVASAHRATTASMVIPEKEREIIISLPKNQKGQIDIDAQDRTKTADELPKEKKREEPPTEETHRSREDSQKKPEEARALLEQMGYAANRTVLLESAESGNTTLVHLLLTAGVSPDEQDSRGWTPLMYAAWNGHIATVHELIRSGANPNTRNAAGGTALMLAAMNGHTALVDTLRKKGVDVNSKDTKGWTPLMYAAWNGHTATVQSVLKIGADINAKNEEGWTALMYAVWKGHIATVQALLEKRAEPDVHSNDGETAFMMAASQGNARIVELLQHAGARE